MLVPPSLPRYFLLRNLLPMKQLLIMGSVWLALAATASTEVVIPPEVEAVAYDGTTNSLDQILRVFEPAATNGITVAVFVCREVLLERGDNDGAKERFPVIGSTEDTDEAVTEAWRLLLKRKAESGDPFFQKVLGYLYKYGSVFDPDDRTAFTWYEKSAKGGYARGMWLLARCYQYGTGTEENMAEAIKWHSRAAEKGASRAAYDVGMIYLAGSDAERNHTEAAKWFKRAAELGNACSKCRLAWMYCNGLGLEPDYDMAIKLYQELLAMEEDHRCAVVGMAYIYDKGLGVASNPDRATELYLAGARMGDVYATTMISLRYEKGLGVKRNLLQAAYWAKEAAERGDANAQNRLGTYLQRGWGTPSNSVEAVKWFRKAAEKGHGGAQYNLGMRIEEGRATTGSIAEAAEWFRKSAEKGLKDAQYKIGEYLEEGRGTKKDIPEAAKWFRKAADQGVLHAFYRLGRFYSDGRGVEQDLQEAFKLQQAVLDGGCEKHGAGGMAYAHEMNGDYEAALTWYLTGSKWGDGWTMERLGRLYMEGAGIEKDTAAAVVWLAKAARKRSSAVDLLRQLADEGEVIAQLKLAQLYHSGVEGTLDADHGEALFWCMKADSHGYDEAGELIDTMRAHGTLTDNDFEQARKRLNEGPKRAADGKWYLELADNSTVVGEPSFTSVVVNVSFGKVHLSIDKINSVTFSGKDSPARVLLWNGDTLDGTVELGAFIVDDTGEKIPVDGAKLDRIRRH